MTNLLEKIIVYGAAITLGGCTATGSNVRKEQRLSPKFGYEQIEQNLLGCSVYCPDGWIEPLTCTCINGKSIFFEYAKEGKEKAENQKGDESVWSEERRLKLEASLNEKCLPSRHEREEDSHLDQSFPWPQPRPRFPVDSKRISYGDSRQGMEEIEKPRCCCPPGTHAPCCDLACGDGQKGLCDPCGSPRDKEKRRDGPQYHPFYVV